MAQPYIGEIRLFAGNFAPAGWEFCDGRLMDIATYDTLFVLIGTTYGGDGQTTFALPDLRGRLPMHQGNGVLLGEQLGVERVMLTLGSLAAHSHGQPASNQPATTSSPVGGLFAQGEEPLYASTATSSAPLLTTTATGGGQSHENRQPYLGLNFIISLFGIFPSP